MNKSEMAKEYMEEYKKIFNVSITKKDAIKNIDAFVAIMTRGLRKRGDNVRFVGFGTLKVVLRKARRGRNPSNGKLMSIPEALDIKFSLGSSHKAYINN